MSGSTLASTLASVTYDYAALALGFRTLEEIPFRAFSPQRAMKLAVVAEGLSTRAESDRRFDLALDIQDLAVKAWQRAGAIDACRRAMVRHGEIVEAGGR